MNAKFKTGQRVKYRRETKWFTRECSGTIREFYPGGYPFTDDEGNKQVTENAYSVEVDQPLPDWWPYVGKTRFAPDESELTAATPQGEGKGS